MIFQLNSLLSFNLLARREDFPTGEPRTKDHTTEATEGTEGTPDLIQKGQGDKERGATTDEGL